MRSHTIAGFAIVLLASSAAAQVHVHDAADHGASGGTPVEYLTLNVAVSDTGIEPSVLFVPAGRPIQLMLRNRGTTEHHYHVVGLAPDDLTWVIPGVSAGAASSEEHNHHNRTYVRTRAASPAGITPTGQEVHAYVSEEQRIDVVLFTATQTGTYVVKCDRHPETIGRLTVFDPAGAAGRAGGLSAPAAGAGARAEQGFRIGGLRRRVGRPYRCDVCHRGVRHAGTGRTRGGGRRWSQSGTSRFC